MTGTTPSKKLQIFVDCCVSQLLRLQVSVIAENLFKFIDLWVNNFNHWAVTRNHLKNEWNSLYFTLHDIIDNLYLIHDVRTNIHSLQPKDVQKHYNKFHWMYHLVLTTNAYIYHGQWLLVCMWLSIKKIVLIHLNCF